MTEDKNKDRLKTEDGTVSGKKSGRTTAARSRKQGAGKTVQETGEIKLSETFASLEELLLKLNEEEGLEESFRLYQQGVLLLKQANESIDRVEKQVRVLDEEGILS